MKIGVVLMNMGGPNNEDAVQPFLYNLFMDDDIIKLPFKKGLRKPLAKLISTKRAKSVSEKYKEINACPNGCLGPKTCSNRVQKLTSGCCSSTNPITELQRRELEKLLKQRNPSHSFKVVTQMRYWHPFTDQAIDELLEADCQQIVLLPLYPHFSYSTTASNLNEWHRRIKARGLEEKWETFIVKDYPSHPRYIQAINQRINEGLSRFSGDQLKKVHLLFSAHGTPVSYREDGDPYSFQIKETMESVMTAREKDYPYWLSYQSRVGPVKWLQPNTEDFLEVLYGYGVRYLLVIPIAFVSDHIETTHEVGIEFREVADHLGYAQFEVTKGLNGHPEFLGALAELVEQKTLQGERAVAVSS